MINKEMTQKLFGPVSRSSVFRTPNSVSEGGDEGTLVDKIGSCIRNVRAGASGIFSTRFSSPPPLTPFGKENSIPSTRYRRGELIGSGAFGRVYMGMDLDTGELIAVKQVSITRNHASKEEVQDLEEEVKFMENLSHPNIVRYLGTDWEDGTLNILLEYVPGGSISSLLAKFGAFPETVIRKYTKQLLLGLEYLHKNKILHRDIKGANILVDNKGCIKLADFGASKKVVLATITGAKSMKGTAFWMAPEVIREKWHDTSADIWSVGCTVIEMAIGKPPWSQHHQEVAVLFHVGTTKEHPPIPDHLSAEAKDFLLKCLHKEPNKRLKASELLQHPFISGECRENRSSVLRGTSLESCANPLASCGSSFKNSIRPVGRPRRTCSELKDVLDKDSVRCSTVYPDKFKAALPMWGPRSSDDDICCMGDEDFGSLKFSCDNMCISDLNKSFNPMCEPTDEHWSSFKFDAQAGRSMDFGQPVDDAADSDVKEDFTFPCEPLKEDQVAESKIRAFLDEKALELKELETPLFEDFYNTLKGFSPFAAAAGAAKNDSSRNYSPKSRTAGRVAVGSNIGGGSQDVVLPKKQPIFPSVGSSDKLKSWKKELDQELEETRELMRQAGKPSPQRAK